MANIKPGNVLTKAVCTWLLPADYAFIKEQAKHYNITFAACLRMIIVDARLASKAPAVPSEKWYSKPDVLPTITRLLATEMTSEQIAEKLGVSRHALERFIKRNGIANLAGRRKKIDRSTHAISKAKPWQALGISRTTWYRQQWGARTAPSNGHYKEEARV